MKLGKCQWCNGENLPLVKHHHPIPRSQGGKEVVEICNNCHAKFHWGTTEEKLPPQKPTDPNKPSYADFEFRVLADGYKPLKKDILDYVHKRFGEGLGNGDFFLMDINGLGDIIEKIKKVFEEAEEDIFERYWEEWQNIKDN